MKLVWRRHFPSRGCLHAPAWISSFKKLDGGGSCRPNTVRDARLISSQECQEGVVNHRAYIVLHGWGKFNGVQPVLGSCRQALIFLCSRTSLSSKLGAYFQGHGIIVNKACERAEKWSGRYYVECEPRVGPWQSLLCFPSLLKRIPPSPSPSSSYSLLVFMVDLVPPVSLTPKSRLGRQQ